MMQNPRSSRMPLHTLPSSLIDPLPTGSPPPMTAYPPPDPERVWSQSPLSSPRWLHIVYIPVSARDKLGQAVGHTFRFEINVISRTPLALFKDRYIFMIYCCACKGGRKESTNDECVLVKSEAPRRQQDIEQKARERGDVLPRAEEMHGVAGVPESPQAGGFRPGQALYEPRQAAALYNPIQLSFDSPQRRLGKRAPKLGDIGRSKKVIYDPGVAAILDDTGPSTVVIEDEELDDILNNNGLFPLSVRLTPVA
ncbi:UNVERIFIED_CONTAM: hypothetical protein FKN15_053538 [Acipenser sinensis]